MSWRADRVERFTSASLAILSVVFTSTAKDLSTGSRKSNGVKMLVYYEQHATAISAIQREKNIKHWSRKWKIDLITSTNREWRDLWEEVVR
jgi:predicted GIY-YIG superfamily endonuclease